ncbi:hypothetical protein P692DRAFT_20870468 [Suillus brevipes Sb2]|nr:hypothetical protein P692DRAFT_20870468 [Suillus brevipes Sb2]
MHQAPPSPAFAQLAPHGPHKGQHRNPHQPYDTVFREPQLVSEDTISTDQLPALIPSRHVADCKQYPPLPDQDRRKHTDSCADDAFDKGKKTHHFHLYPKAVDSGQLNSAFHRAPWKVAVQRKQKRRKITSVNLDDCGFKEPDERRSSRGACRRRTN